MAESNPQPEQTEQQPPGSGGEVAESSPRGWREVWQLPTLAAAGLLLVAGLVAVLRSDPEPDYASMLETAERLIEDRRYEDAIGYLNEEVFPAEAEGALSPELRPRFYSLLARSLWLGQRALQVSLDANHENVLRAYEEAEKAGYELSARDRQFIAESLIALRRFDGAKDQIGALPRGEQGERVRLMRALIVAAEEARDGSRVDGLLSELLADATLSPDDRAWAVEKQIAGMIRGGFVDQAVSKLLRELQRVEGAGARARGSLLLLLGEAYATLGSPDQAEKQLDAAEALLHEADGRLARIGVLRSRIARQQGQLDRSREIASRTAESFALSDELPAALLELGRVEAQLGRTGPALEAFERLVEEMKRGARHPEVSREVIAEDLAINATERRQQGAPGEALRFSLLADDLYPLEERPASILLELALAHRALADQLLPEGPDQRSLAGLAPSAREEARRHLIASGSLFRQHATAMILPDNVAYERSLWLAADSFDLSGDLPEAIGAFREYAGAFPDEPRRAEARYRLGRASLALGELDQAAEYFRGLIADRANPEVKHVGLFGDLSFVPLAQTLLLDDDAGNDGEAEDLLRAVIEGRVSSEPDTELMRQALIAMGRLMASRGEYGRAIERFETVLSRFPDREDEPLVSFELAEAYRLEAERLNEELGGDLSAQRRREIGEVRRERLVRAHELYDGLIREIEAGRGTLGPLGKATLRNAYYFRGSCAFDLGEFELAIREYDAAYERYPDEPASLVSLVQIVNASIELGDFDRARTSHERARRFFRSLPDSVWDDPDLPMGRRQWERWLDTAGRLYAQLEEDDG